MSNRNKKYKPQGRPGGNPDIIAWRYKAAVPGKPKNKNLTVKVDDETLAQVKSLPNWSDRVRQKIEELLQEQAIATNTETYPTGGGAGYVIR